MINDKTHELIYDTMWGINNFEASSKINKLLYMHRGRVCQLTGNTTSMSLRSFTDPGLDYGDFLIDVLVDIEHPLLILISDA